MVEEDGSALVKGSDGPWPLCSGVRGVQRRGTLRRLNAGASSLSGLSGKVYALVLGISINVLFFLDARDELANLLQSWCCASHLILICLLLFILGHFPFQGGSQLPWWSTHAQPAHRGEGTHFAFLSLPPRSYLLVLEVVGPLSAADASPAARLIWIQGGNMD